jgi:hypothetical protein
MVYPGFGRCPIGSFLGANLEYYQRQGKAPAPPKWRSAFILCRSLDELLIPVYQIFPDGEALFRYGETGGSRGISHNEKKLHFEF